MAEFTTDATLNGYFKRRYGKVVTLLPQGFKFQRDVRFKESKLVGDSYHEPIELTHEHGFTYAKGDTDAFQLADAVAFETKNAEIQASQIMLRARFGVKAVTRSRTNKQAFGQIYDRKVKNMYLSMRKRVEIECMYGQSGYGIGQVASVTVTGTNDVVTLADLTFAAGIWAGMENAKVQAYSVNTHRSTGAEFWTITAIDLQAKTITLNNTVAHNWSAGDQIYFGESVSGSGYWFGQHSDSGTQSAKGLHRIICGGHDLATYAAYDDGDNAADYSADTVFSIDPDSYSLWKSSIYDMATTQMSWRAVNNAVTLLVAKGLDEDLCLLLSPNAWAQLMDDEMAAGSNSIRRNATGSVSGKGKTLRVGADGLEFVTQNGLIKIKASNYVHESMAYLFPVKYWERLGSTEPTFEVLGRKDHFFHDVADKAGFELRCYTDQASFTEQPGKCLAFVDISTQAAS